MSIFTVQRSILKPKSPLPIRIIKGLEGTTKDGKDLTLYHKMFIDRYARLTDMIKESGHNFYPVGALPNIDTRKVATIGMLSDIRTTKKTGSKMVSLEDLTGELRGIITKKNEDTYNIAETLMLDEVVGIIGGMSEDKSVFFINEIIRPDVPRSFKPHRSATPAKACFVSDVHIGSNTFLPEAWERFIDWVSMSDVNYLLIAGDVVDGIGIYPDQELELNILSIYEQYAAVAKTLQRIPLHIRVVISLGNHDVVRGAEPQPALPEQFRGAFNSNVLFVENPAYISLNGVTVLMYHGRSFDDMIKFLPGASYDNIGYVMEEALKRRLLCSTFGEKTPIIPAATDMMVIDPIPDVFLTGHVHIMGITQYKGVLCMNAGCWQSQTAYQKQFGTIPTPGRAIVLNLQTFQYEVKRFWDEDILSE